MINLLDKIYQFLMIADHNPHHFLNLFKLSTQSLIFLFEFFHSNLIIIYFLTVSLDLDNLILILINLITNKLIIIQEKLSMLLNAL